MKDSVKAEMLRKDSLLKGSHSPSGSPGPSTSVSHLVDNKTQAQRRFDEVQRNRVSCDLYAVGVVLSVFIQRAERVAKLATKTHKDRVHEFNEKLEALSEHHDIPKVCQLRYPIRSTLISHLRSGWTRVNFLTPFRTSVPSQILYRSYHNVELSCYCCGSSDYG